MRCVCGAGWNALSLQECPVLAGMPCGLTWEFLVSSGQASLLGSRVRVWLSRVPDAQVGPGEAAGPCRDARDWEVPCGKSSSCEWVTETKAILGGVGSGWRVLLGPIPLPFPDSKAGTGDRRHTGPKLKGVYGGVGEDLG